MDKDKINYNLLIAKKTEKTAIAIYLISQFLNDNENIKLELRKETNKLLKKINEIAFDGEKNIFVLYKNCLDTISVLISYLTIAKESNLISKMNVDIVIDALRLLENILIKKQFKISKENLYINEENILLDIFNKKENIEINTNTSFDVFTERFANIAEEVNKKTLYNFEKNKNENILSTKRFLEKNTVLEEGSIKDNSVYKRQFINDNNKKINNIKDNNEFLKDSFDKNNTKNNRQNSSEKIVKSNTENKFRDINKMSKMAKNQDRKDNRREQILALFTRGVEVTINDISKKIIGCSVKTIQRELNDLVDENRIEKIGDKRWSKYILSK